MRETFGKIYTSSKILRARFQVSEMALMGHDTFNSNKIYFFLITWLIGYRKGLAKITTGILHFKLECAKTFLMKFYSYGSIFREKFQAALECAFNESDTPSSSLLSEDEGLRDIGHIGWGLEI